MFKLTTASLLAVFAASVAAQSIPQYQSFPAACSSQCASSIEASVLCYREYTTGQEIVSCYCNAEPSSSDVSNCSSCLSSNGASELAGVLSAIPDACSTYERTCQKECGFDTCASSDIACQCSESYLASIYQCASCNTRNNNVGATTLTDYEALAGSCGQQNFTLSSNVPATTSSALPSPTGQASYSAPSLAVSASSYSMGASSVTGFAISMDGSTTTVAVSSSASVRASSVSSASSGAVSAASSSARASSSSAASASSARASSASASGSAAPAATSPASGALSLGVNAVGIVGAIFGVVALF